MSERYSNVKTVTINPNKTDAYTCMITYLDENPDTSKVLSKVGIHLLEEALLDILPSPDEDYVSINAIKTHLGFQMNTNDTYNWSGYLIEGILTKLQSEFRTQPEVSTTNQGIERRIGWRLSRNEYQKRLDNEEEYTEE